MDSSKLNRRLPDGGNVGIFVGLIFVGFQLYQERELKAIEMAMSQLERTVVCAHAE